MQIPAGRLVLATVEVFIKKISIFFLLPDKGICFVVPISFGWVSWKIHLYI